MWNRGHEALYAHRTSLGSRGMGSSLKGKPHRDTAALVRDTLDSAFTNQMKGKYYHFIWEM